MTTALATQKGQIHFDFGPLHIRIASGSGADVWLVAADVAEQLGAEQDGGQFTRDLPEGQTRLQNVETSAGSRATATVNLDGLFALIERTRTDRARAVQAWIRKNTVVVVTAGPPVPAKRVSALRAEKERIRYEIEERKAAAELPALRNQLAALKGEPLPHPEIVPDIQGVVIRALQAGPELGMTRTELRASVGRHVAQEHFSDILDRLEEMGSVRIGRVSSGGRPTQIIRLVRAPVVAPSGGGIQ